MKPRRQAQRIPAQRRGRRRAGPPPDARRMACAALLSCAAMLAACGGGGGSSTAPPETMPPETMPPAAQAALTVTAGGSASGGGSVSVAVGSGVAGVVGAGASSSVAAAGDTVTLTATAADGWAFAGWTLSGGLACADGPAGNPCTLAAGSLSADATATAAFEAVQRTLTVTAGPGGSVAVKIGVADVMEVGAGSSQGFAVSVLSETTLTAVAAAGYESAGWALSLGGLACAGETATEVCALPAGSLTADVTATAAFGIVTYRLSVDPGANGEVAVTVGSGPAVTVGAGTTRGFSVDVSSEVTLTATATDSQRHRFTGWALSGGNGLLACAASNPCMLAAGSFTADATATAVFAAVFAMEVSAGAGGSVAVTVGGGAAGSVTAGNSTDVAVAAGSAVVLEALPANPNVFAGWTGACAGAGARCELAPTAGASAAATFGSVAMTLAVSAGAGGGVDVVIGQAATRTVGAGSESTYVVAAASPAALTARPGFDRLFERWTPLGGLELPCADPAAAVCELDAGSASGGAAATFRTRQSALTVSAGDGGSVAVSVGDLAVTVTAGSSTDVAVAVDDAVALAAMPAVSARFVHWALSDGLACAGGLEASPCMLARVGADGSAAAVFSPLPDSVSWTGPGTVTVDGSTLTATPYADGAFEAWQGGPCDGSAALECARSPLPDAGYPVAVFRPFVAAGIKSLAFGLGYQGADPDHFSISFRSDMGAGYDPVAGLDDLPPGSGPARLQVPVHLLPWGLGGYLTEACDASNNCSGDDRMLSGGERMLEQSDSVAAIGYIKAPDLARQAQFGSSGVSKIQVGHSGNTDNTDGVFPAIALSDDGATLAVGAANSANPSTGTFVPGEEGYQAALDTSGDAGAGATYVYRRSSAGQWTVEAFIKTPKASESSDRFGFSVALSADGATLAVGAPYDDSSATGTFAPTDPGYRAALDDVDAIDNGAAYVYRRSGAGQWTVEAFIKAPVVGAFESNDDSLPLRDFFGGSVALSADGSALAVGAPFEDSASTGTFAPSDADDYQAALDDNGATDSGAVTVYRRSGAGRWTIEAFLKAPNAAAGKIFGFPGLALSRDGSLLATSSARDDSSATGTFAPGDADYQAALDDNGARRSGAVTVYRRSTLTETWAVEAFVKAPVAGANDYFPVSIALPSTGAVMVLGTPYEDSSATGTFAPSDAGYQAALDDNGATNSGAAYVYRRSGAGQWTVEAFVKPPVADVAYDYFGVSVDLSSNGVVMAVGSSGEDSSFSGVFTSGFEGLGAAQANNDAGGSESFGIGAAYVYRRSSAGQWTVDAFIKPPNGIRVAGRASDAFGSGVQLSRDGETLAVAAPSESADAAQPVSSGADASLDRDDASASRSGAVYLY